MRRGRAESGGRRDERGTTKEGKETDWVMVREKDKAGESTGECRAEREVRRKRVQRDPDRRQGG